jgi:predicted TIM-barrel fold metal-dependent hydrolase
MTQNRRDFLKRTGLAGMILSGATILPACSSGTSQNGASGQDEQADVRTDPEWQDVRYGEWGGPGVSVGPGPMDDVLVKEHAPRSTLVVEKTFVPTARYPVIDVHVHHYPGRSGNAEARSTEEALADWVKTQDEVGIETSVVLTGATGDEFDRLVEMYLEPYPDRFHLYCGIETTDISAPDYPERAAAELERCYEQGARGVGEITDKGFGITGDSDLAPEERMHHDDPRLDPVWQKCAALNLPVNVHIADHPSAWTPPDMYQERYPIFQQYNQYGGSGLSYEELVTILPRLLDRHPETTFIACHFANQGNDLQTLAGLLDQHSNLYLDVSARDYEIGRQPRAAARFLENYSDRVLYGSDMGMKKAMYQNWWRLLESADEYMTGRAGWRYYALELPDPVLEALYRTNAERIMNWEEL